MACSASSNCTICLEPVVYPTFVVPCDHIFCFTCITKWEKVRNMCPLCKGRIEHFDLKLENIKYAAIKANSPEAMEGLERLRTEFLTFVESPELESFQIESTPNFRRRIYEFGLWVQLRTDSPLNSCPELYRANSAWDNKFMQWLIRELTVLYSGSVIQAAVDILHLVRQHPIRSPDFASRISQYTGRYTEQFVHEFYSFASSSSDSVFTYDEECQYVLRDELFQEGASTQEVITLSDSSDDDCVFVARYLRHPSNPGGGASTQEAGPSVTLSDSDDD